ncbi:MAG: sodium/substrate symporter small subunit, partial [Hyphomicrobiaceae bacterium]
MTGKHRELEPASAADPDPGFYWRRSRRLALSAVVAWVIVALLLPMASKYMEAVAVLGIPLGYYAGSIGGLVAVALLLLIVAIRQRRIDDTSV